MNNGAELVICFCEAPQERCQTVVMYADIKRPSKQISCIEPRGMLHRD